MDIRSTEPRRRRLQAILKLLARSERVLVEELCSEFESSPATIRRDLEILEQHGLLIRDHGGAVSVAPLFYGAFAEDYSFQEQVTRQHGEKKRIALAAAELVQDGETVTISAGTTTTQVARGISFSKRVTLFTNAVNMAMELGRRRNLTVHLTGGVMRGSWFSLVGPEAIESAQRVIVDRAFLSVSGITPEAGLTDFHPEEAAVNRIFLAHARKRIIVADHTKFSVLASHVVADLKNVDIIITGIEALDELVQPYVDMGIEVRRV
jgi:DeoR family transcriptional regulator, aga operon transcriptional repressor